MQRFRFVPFMLLAISLLSRPSSGVVEVVHLQPTPQMKGEIARLLDVLDRVTETKYFHQGGPSDQALVQFAVLYNNNLGPYHLADSTGKYRLPAAYIDQLTLRYFGRRVRHRSFPEYPYKNGVYLASGSDAAEPEQIRIDWVDRHGNNEYEANATFIDRVTKKVTARRKVTLKRVGQGKQSRYIVLEYGQGCAC